MTQPTLLSEKLHKFGVLGAGVIPNSFATLHLAQAREEEGSALAASSAEDFRPVDFATIENADDLTREQILVILKETVRVQGIVQTKVSVLARKIATEKNEKPAIVDKQEKDGEKGEKTEKKEKKKKVKALSFVDAHKKVLELDLPQEPLEACGLSESSFQQHLQKYETDEEVMLCAQQLLSPAGKGDPDRATAITIEKIIEIHQFMVAQMQKVLHDFLTLSPEVRRSFTSKGCETTAELLVSIAVEDKIAVRCEDVEQAVILCEEALQNIPEFTQCTEQLAGMMQHLIGASQPRVEKAEFVKILAHMGESTKKAKVFAKKLYEDYRAKTCDVLQAYIRFETFSDEMGTEAEDVPELSSVEMRLCYDEYGEDRAVKEAWDSSGVASNVVMQGMMMMSQNPPNGVAMPALEDKKGRKLKSSEIVEMQELMVDELKRTTEAAAAALTTDKAKGANPWRAELAVQMVQALASAAVERRYGISAEDMTMAGFQHAAALQRNERFVRATEKQQEILMSVPSLCGLCE